MNKISFQDFAIYMQLWLIVRWGRNRIVRLLDELFDPPMAGFLLAKTLFCSIIGDSETYLVLNLCP